MLAGEPLHRERDDFTGALVGLLARVGFDLADQTRHIVAGVFFRDRHHLSARLFDRHLGDTLQFSRPFFLEFGEFGALPVERALAFVKRLLALLGALDTLVEVFAAALQALIFSIQLAAAAQRQLGRLIGDLFGLLLGGQHHLLRLQGGTILDRLSLCFGQHTPIAPLGILHEYDRRRADDEAHDQRDERSNYDSSVH